MRKIILLHFSFFCLSYSQDGVWPIDGDTIIGVFLRDSTHTRSSLSALGIKVSTEINGLMTGRVSLSDYRNINRNNSMQWITPVGISHPALDESVVVTHWSSVVLFSMAIWIPNEEYGVK